MRSFVRTLRATLWVARLVFRFFAGRPMSGERKTDATFFRPATRSLDPSGTALRWEMMRGASRAAWRLGGAYLLILLLLIPLLLLAEKVSDLPWYFDPQVILWSNLLSFGGAGVSYLLRRHLLLNGYYSPRVERSEEGRLSLRWERVEGVREWRKEKILPIARSLSVIAGVHIPERKAHQWITVPKNFRDGGSVEVLLPLTFTGADEGVKKRLVSSISSKLGVPGMSPSWMTEGSSPRLLLAAPPTPPKFVEFSDVKEWLLQSEEYRPFLGLTGAGKGFHAEMVADSPHTGLSAGSGAGKSELAKLMMMQALRWGWGIVVLDWKQTNAYSWLGGLPGVIYLSGIEQIHEMGVRIAEEVDLRKTGGMAGRAKVLVVRDEWNVTADLLLAYWQDLRSTAEPEEKKLMPLKSPALRGYAILDFAGREYGLFDLCIAQRFSARIFNGNADIREVFAIKLLARYTPQTVKMLAPDIKPFPRKSNQVGRWVAVVGDEATVIQAPLITNEEAREYALGGKENPITPFTSSFSAQLAQHGPEVDDTQGDQLGGGPTPPNSASSQVNSSMVLLKLSEMVEGLAHLGITLEILRHGVKSDESFPAPKGGNPNRGWRYDKDEVKQWAARRHAEAIAARRS